MLLEISRPAFPWPETTKARFCRALQVICMKMVGDERPPFYEIPLISLRFRDIPTLTRMSIGIVTGPLTTFDEIKCWLMLVSRKDHAMGHSLRSSTLVPRGFIVDNTAIDDDVMLIAVRPTSKAGFCPICGTRSEQIHGRYQRRLADLPLVGKPVRLVIEARRFHCDALLCGRQIFAERFDGDILAPSARQTARLDRIVHHLGLALGGRPAAAFAKRLMLPVSNDTLLRVVRRRGSPRFVPPPYILKI